MNARARVSSKGQIVVPKAVRDELGLATGSEVEFVRKGDGFLVQSVDRLRSEFPPQPRGAFRKHVLKIEGRFPTEADLDRAMLAEAARRFDATRR